MKFENLFKPKKPDPTSLVIRFDYHFIENGAAGKGNSKSGHLTTPKAFEDFLSGMKQSLVGAASPTTNISISGKLGGVKCGREFTDIGQFEAWLSSNQLLPSAPAPQPVAAPSM